MFISPEIILVVLLIRKIQDVVGYSLIIWVVSNVIELFNIPQQGFKMKLL